MKKLAPVLLVSVAVGFSQPLVIRAITDNGMLQQDMGVIARSLLMLVFLLGQDYLTEGIALSSVRS